LLFVLYVYSGISVHMNGLDKVNETAHCSISKWTDATASCEVLE